MDQSASHTEHRDLFARGLENSIRGQQDSEKTEPAVMPLRVGVSNGDLRFASYPVIVGHFRNDGLLDAEVTIDNYLGGALSNLHRFGLYPGEVGTSEFFPPGGRSFHGAIVVGLGSIGTLTAFQLSITIEQAVLKFLLQHPEEMRPGFSVLPIGCGYGGLSIESSLRAILLGIQSANAGLASLSSHQHRQIDKVEVIEQYEDRALDCFYALHAIEKEAAQSLHIISEGRQFKKLFGSRRRLPRDNNADWWTRIRVQQRMYEKEGESIPGLQFNISTGGAREEQRHLYSSRDTIMQLVGEFSIQNRWTPALAKTFFELMVPADFKEQLKRKSNVCWVVDKETAAYPWELLQDGTDNAKPLSVTSGMVRQLATQDFRLKVHGVMENTALVVADPDLQGFAGQLPGALREGRLVSSLLNEAGFDAKGIFNGHPSGIIEGLFSSDYRLIHLAGHGVFNEADPERSGMLIGKERFLKSRDIAQMSTVPELVFVNCCYLGKISGETEALYQQRYRFAANIGTQLIDNGVKAVVVAGWAVDDEAALVFTEHFYRELFAGATFGNAVQRARNAVYHQFPRTNTWGAYQCYGDQFYQLNPQYQEPAGKDFVLPVEAEIELANLLNKTDIPDYDTTALFRELEAISEGVERCDVRNGAITEKEALVCYALGDYEKAVSKYESLLPMEKADFSFSALEKFCNMRAKLAVMQFRKGGVALDELNKQMERVIIDLERMLQFSETAERLCMLASAYKRKAQVANTSEKPAAYAASAFYYFSAADQRYRSLYGYTNWLQVEQVMVAQGLRQWGEEIAFAGKRYKLPGREEAVQDLLGKLALISGKQETGDMDYWEMSAAANIQLCLWLLQPGDAAFDAVKDAYRRLWLRAGSRGNRQAEREQLEFLSAAYTDAPGGSSGLVANKLASFVDALSSFA